MIGYFQAMMYHAESNDRHGYLWTLTNMFRLMFTMANEAELAPVLSAACSLKHATDMKKTFQTQSEAFDRAKQMGPYTRTSSQRSDSHSAWTICIV